MAIFLDGHGGYCTCTRDKCTYDCATYRRFKPKPITNSMRIRTMTDEELAKFIEFVSSGCDYMFPDCPAHDSCKLVCDQMDACRKGWLDWLKQEATK